MNSVYQILQSCIYRCMQLCIKKVNPGIFDRLFVHKRALLMELQCGFHHFSFEMSSFILFYSLMFRCCLFHLLCFVMFGFQYFMFCLHLLINFMFSYSFDCFKIIVASLLFASLKAAIQYFSLLAILIFNLLFVIDDQCFNYFVKHFMIILEG